MLQEREGSFKALRHTMECRGSYLHVTSANLHVEDFRSIVLRTLQGSLRQLANPLDHEDPSVSFGVA